MILNTISESATHKIESSGVISPPVPETKITRLAFKNRMTQDERIAIRTESETNYYVLDFMDLVADASFIDLSREDTIAGVNYLEGLGLLATGRADEILNTPVSPVELV